MNNLKMFVSKIADRGRADSTASSRDDDVDPVPSTNSAEGFICPMCHLDLTSMESLQEHFEMIHTERSMASPEPPKDVARANPDLEDLKVTVRMLQENLEAERNHSASLKEAMDDLKQTFLSKDGKDMDLLAEYKTEILDLRAKSESSISKISAISVELSHARSELEEKTRSGKELRSSLQQRDDLVSSLEKQLAKQDAELQSKNADVARLEESLEVTKKREAEANERIAALSAAVAETQTKWEGKNAAASEIAAERDDIRVKLNVANEQIAALKCQLSSSSSEHSKLAAQLDSQRQAVLALKKQLAASVPGSPGEDVFPGLESEVSEKFSAVLGIDRCDEYTSFVCHVEALNKVSSEMVRACRRLDDGLRSMEAGEDSSIADHVTKALGIVDSFDGEDLLTVGKNILSNGNVLYEEPLAPWTHEVDAFLDSISVEERDDVRRGLLAGMLLMQKIISSGAKCAIIGALPEKTVHARDASEVRKMCFALIENATEALRSVLEASNSRIDGEIQKCFKANGEVQSLSKDLENLRAELQTQTNAIQSYQKELHEKAKLFETCQNELKFKSEALAASEGEVALKDKSAASLSAELDLKMNEVNELRTTIAALKETHFAEEAEWKATFESDQNRIRELVQQLDNLNGSRESLEREFDILRAELSQSLQNAEAALESERRKVLELESSKRSMLSAVASEFQSAMEALSSYVVQKEELISEMLASHDKRLAKLLPVIENLKASSSATRSAVRAKSTEIELLLADIAEGKEAQKEMKQMFVDEKMALEMQLDEKTSDVARLESRIDEIQNNHAAVLDDLNELLACTKRKLEKEEGELEDAKGQLMEREQLLKTMRSTCNEMSAEKDREIEELQNLLADASGKRLELEALVSSEIEEKRAILDRFTAIEGEVVSLRATNSDLMRKLNDVEAGLHELGRENQSLQVELAKTQSRKWMDDTGVENCQACDKGFTLTIRKHHCRQCGRIYCHECSSKTATLPSSKKPVRVCDKCYTELHP